MLYEFQNQVKITDDLLATLFCEVENILNSKPLTTVTSDEDCVALTAIDILRLNSNHPFPVPRCDPSKGYVHRKWKQAQSIADAFWRRYKKEYLTTL